MKSYKKCRGKLLFDSKASLVKGRWHREAMTEGFIIKIKNPAGFRGISFIILFIRLRKKLPGLLRLRNFPDFLRFRHQPLPLPPEQVPDSLLPAG